MAGWGAFIGAKGNSGTYPFISGVLLCNNGHTSLPLATRQHLPKTLITWVQRVWTMDPVSPVQPVLVGNVEVK